jgi:hypothetical protein
MTRTCRESLYALVGRTTPTVGVGIGEGPGSRVGGHVPTSRQRPASAAERRLRAATHPDPDQSAGGCSLVPGSVTRHLRSRPSPTTSSQARLFGTENKHRRKAWKTALPQYFAARRTQPAPEFVWYGSAVERHASTMSETSAQASKRARDDRRAPRRDQARSAVEAGLGGGLVYRRDR